MMSILCVLKGRNGIGRPTRYRDNHKGLPLLVFVVLLLLGQPVWAQSADPAAITLDRLFNSGDFRGDWFGPARWLEDGSGYTTLESSEAVSQARDIVRYDPATGEREVLVSAKQLIPSGQEEALAIHNYSWSPGGNKLLVFTNSRRVWRQNTRGDYWVLDLESGSLQQLGGDAEESTLMFAKFSPDGTRVAYVQKNNLYVENLADGAITQLTSDGSRTIINGTFDWVYEEEFFLRDGFRWSPDGTAIAFWQLDAEGVGVFNMINNTDSLYSKIIPLQYPKAGTTNSSGKVGVVPAAGGDITWFQLSEDPRNHYIARMDWAANSDEIIMQHLNRRQDTLEVVLGNVHSGEVRTVFVDHDDAWIDVVDDLIWLDEGATFTWVSERDGWRHAYLISRTGKDIQTITNSEHDILNIVRIDTEAGWLYYMASPEDAGQRYLYRTPLRGGGPAERLSPTDQPGTHSYQMSHDARWAIHTYSTFGSPPVISLISLPDHEVVRTLVDNERLRETVDALTLGETEFFRIDVGDGLELDGWMIKPSDFDPLKKYPVLFYVYGEPWSQTVRDQWSGSRLLWHHLVAEQGYLVISIDNRGTPAPRGRNWRKVVHGQIGVIASQDQAAAARAIGEWDFVDASRIGIWGWSGGGSMTLNMLFRYPELYHTGMSIAPVPDQRYYDTIYQERYSGLPSENAEGYRLGSPITFAHQLEGNLLLVHGTGDDNVHYQGSEALINKLVEHNKHFTMMSYPNRSHGIWEGPGTTRHLYGLLTRYLMENLPPGPVSVTR